MSFILLLQVPLALLLSFIILVQHRASGLGAAFGGTGASYVQRRGAEMVLHRLTIVVSILFFALTLVDWYV